MFHLDNFSYYKIHIGAISTGWKGVCMFAGRIKLLVVCFSACINSSYCKIRLTQIRYAACHRMTDQFRYTMRRV